MQVPVSMLRGAGGTKAAAILAALIGLAIVTAIKKQRSSTGPTGFTSP